MLYEFAMTPDLFDKKVISDDLAGTILVQLLRGLEVNGLLADFHKGKWSEHITQRMVSISPKWLDKIKACLTVLKDRNRLVRHPKCMSGDPQCDGDWLNLAFESNSRNAFQGIFLSQQLKEGCLSECAEYIGFYDALDSVRWRTLVNRSQSVIKTEDDYRLALLPILRHAKSLLLIDPYMNAIDSRFFETVKMCAKLMGQRGQARLDGRIHIHAELKRQKPEGLTLDQYLNEWEKKLTPHASSEQRRFKVFLWEAIDKADKPHDRFFLTDQCGISVPGGLDCRYYSQANTTDWSLLDEHVRKNRWAEYEPATSPYKLMGEREIR